MTDLAILLGSIVAALWGIWAARKSDAPWAWRIPAIVLCLAAAINAIAFALLTGDGRVLPGSQLNPDLARMWGELIHESELELPSLWLFLAPLFAHLALWLPARTGFWRALPMTAVFSLIFFPLWNRTGERPLVHAHAIGPTADAHVTVVPGDDEAEIVFSFGLERDALLDVVHVHRSGTTPRTLTKHVMSVAWTKDGRVMVFGLHRQRIFAVTVEGETVGWLPEAAADWPRATPSTLSKNTLIRLSEARKDVDIFVRKHGGIYVPADDTPEDVLRAR